MSLVRSDGEALDHFQDHRARRGSTIDLTTAIDKKRDTAYEIYLGLYQAITGPEERQKPFREFSPGFFDLIVIDECHRGSGRRIPWREILEYFSGVRRRLPPNRSQ